MEFCYLTCDRFNTKHDKLSMHPAVCMWSLLHNMITVHTIDCRQTHFNSCLNHSTTAQHHCTSDAQIATCTIIPSVINMSSTIILTLGSIPIELCITSWGILFHPGPSHSVCASQKDRKNKTWYVYWSFKLVKSHNTIPNWGEMHATLTCWWVVDHGRSGEPNIIPDDINDDVRRQKKTLNP